MNNQFLRERTTWITYSQKNLVLIDDNAAFKSVYVIEGFTDQSLEKLIGEDNKHLNRQAWEVFLVEHI